jgi:hypothetical protein
VNKAPPHERSGKPAIADGDRLRECYKQIDNFRPVRQFEVFDWEHVGDLGTLWELVVLSADDTAGDLTRGERLCARAHEDREEGDQFIVPIVDRSRSQQKNSRCSRKSFDFGVPTRRGISRVMCFVYDQEVD